MGIAPKANIINLRVLDQNGVGTTSALLNAIEWIRVNYRTYNIRVVNISLGTPAIDSIWNDPLCYAVEDLNYYGILVVAAAGNNGKTTDNSKIYGQIHSPGNDPSVLTVGASNTLGTNSRSDDIMSTYSSHGPTRSYWTDESGYKHHDNVIKPDIVAPGNKIVAASAPSNKLVTEDSTLTNSTLDVAGTDNDMMYQSGTSMATPVASGAAALLFQLNPKLTPTMVKTILQYTAQPLNGVNMYEQGTGQINVDGAVRLARTYKFDTDFNWVSKGSSLFQPSQSLPAATSTIAGSTFPWAQGACSHPA
jgi:subtilisin family serine protease